MRNFRFAWFDRTNTCLVVEDGNDLRGTREVAKEKVKDIIGKTDCRGPYREVLEREVRLKDRTTFWEEAVGTGEIDDYIAKYEGIVTAEDVVDDRKTAQIENIIRGKKS